MDVTVFAQGRPIAQAAVEALYGIGLARVATVLERTDQDGKARLRVPPGECSLTVRAEGFALVSTSAVSPSEQRIDLELGAPIIVSIRTSDGTAIEKASLRAYLPVGGPPVGDQVRGGSPGLYLINDLAIRPYRVVVSCPPLKGVVLNDVVPGQSTREVVLGRGSTLTGHVVDRLGNGVRKATVSAFEPGAVTVFAASDSEGRFTLEGLGEGTVSLWVRGPRLLPRMVNEAKAGSEAILVILDKGGDIEIHFGGTEIPNEVDIALQGRSEDGTLDFIGGYTLTVDEQRVSLGCISGLSWGSYALEVAADGFETMRVDYLLVSPETPVAVANLVARRNTS